MKMERALMHTFNGKQWTKTVTDRIQIQDEAFSEGAFRAAHKATMNWDGKREQFVAKFAKDPTTTREMYFNDIEAQVYAALWAAKWNQAGASQDINYVPCFILELVDRPGRPLCGCEMLIKGTFEKHNNNVGAVCVKSNADEQTQLSLDMAQAFSHFTYENSNKQILICDIQGVGNLYTDPQIHTLSGKGFGAGNLGNTGMSAFLLRHRCNGICQEVGLPVIHAKSLGPEAASRASSSLPTPKLIYRGPNYMAKSAERESQGGRPRFNHTNLQSHVSAKGKESVAAAAAAAEAQEEAKSPGPDPEEVKAEEVLTVPAADAKKTGSGRGSGRGVSNRALKSDRSETFSMDEALMNEIMAMDM